MHNGGPAPRDVSGALHDVTPRTPCGSLALSVVTNGGDHAEGGSVDVEDPERILLAASQHPDPRVGQMVREIVALWAEAKQEVAEAKRELADIKAIALGT